ncbi:MAG TPA: Clp protease N-terminal domain-containing protein, partial [Pseudonocardiaceae bacterium]|nr:Clp protease N-terminal domain-containing protein [Pseudonocardiaceae bacterium]
EAEHPPIGPDIRRAIDGAVAEARGHAVTVAHLFLGLLRAPGSRAGKVLGAHGITRPAALAQLLGLAGRPTQDPA